MDGKAVWDFATVKFPEAVRDVVAKAGYDLEDIDLIVPHQSNINIIKRSMEVLGLPMERAYSHLQTYGNMAGASVPVALDMAVREGRVKRGDLIVTANGLELKNGGIEEIAKFIAGIKLAGEGASICGVLHPASLRAEWRAFPPVRAGRPNIEFPDRDSRSRPSSVRSASPPGGSWK